MTADHDVIGRVVDYLGFELDEGRLDLLDAYAEWLIAEAIPAGGLGPREADRIWDRHIADSLVFGVGWPDTPPGEILDIGTGVGLPGIPLAILFPDAVVTLLDRGGRRVRLLHRAVRILGLANVVIAQADVFAVADEWQSLVSRGSVTAPETVGLAAKLLDVPGTAVVGLSRRPDEPAKARDLVGIATALGLDAEVIQVPAGVLATPAWLLIMRFGG